MRPLEDLIKCGVSDFVNKCILKPHEVTKEEIEDLKFLDNRASNAVELLKDALPALGKVVWMSAKENKTGYLDEDVVFALGVLIENIGEALSASINIERNSRTALQQIEQHQADAMLSN